MTDWPIIVILFSSLFVAVLLGARLVRDDIRRRRFPAQLRGRWEKFDFSKVDQSHGIELPAKLLHLYEHVKAACFWSDWFPNPCFDENVDNNLVYNTKSAGSPKPCFDEISWVWGIECFLPADRQTIEEYRGIISQGFFPFAQGAKGTLFAVSLLPDKNNNHSVHWFFNDNTKRPEAVGESVNTIVDLITAESP